MTRLRLRTLLAAAALCASAPAWAHSLSTRFGGWLGAFLHPLSALDHALAFLALGLLLGFQPLQSARRGVIAFTLALLVGVALPTLARAADIPHIGSVNIASLFVLGVLVALARPLPTLLLVSLAALFGLSHGFENGSDMRSGGAVAILAVAAAGFVVSVVVAMSAQRLRPGAPRVAVRIAGSWIAAIGLMILGFQLRSALSA